MSLSPVYHAFRFCGSQAKTLFLFTKSDIKTTLFPVVGASSFLKADRSHLFLARLVIFCSGFCTFGLDY